MGPRACLDTAEKRQTPSLSGIEPQSLSRAVCSLRDNSDKYSTHLLSLWCGYCNYCYYYYKQFLCRWNNKFIYAYVIDFIVFILGATVVVTRTDLKPKNYSLNGTMRELTNIGKWTHGQGDIIFANIKNMFWDLSFPRYRGLLEYDAVYFVRWVPTFRRNLLSTSSG
jgi:hypothetical protein